jgi:AraC-like DNA-binding protein
MSSLDLKIAWQVHAEPPFERFGYAATRKGPSSEYVAVRTLSGEGEFVFDEQSPCTCRAGQVLLFQRKHLYSYGCSGSAWHYWWFKFSSVLPADVPLFEPIPVGFVPNELTTFTAIFDLLRQPVFERRILGSATFASLLYTWLSTWKTETDASPAQQTVWKVIELMHGHVETGWTVESMAESVCVGVRRLNQLFHGVVGTSPKQYFDDLRLQRAVVLLQGGTLTIAQTAGRLGFDDPYYFSRWIRARLGCPPSKVAKHEGIAAPLSS